MGVTVLGMVNKEEIPDQSNGCSLLVEKVTCGDEGISAEVIIQNNTSEKVVLNDVELPLEDSIKVKDLSSSETVFKKPVRNIANTKIESLVLDPFESRKYKIGYLARMGKGVHFLKFSLENASYHMPVLERIWVVDMKIPVFYIDNSKAARAVPRVRCGDKNKSFADT